MVKIAFLFPGQGSHFVGMSKSLYDKFSVAKQTFEEANEVLGFDLAKLCFEGSLMELNKPGNMFPALLASSVASYRVYFQEIGLAPQICAGHSLGEYSALTCAGVLSFSDALKLVRYRARLAQGIIGVDIGSMTIIDGIDANIIEQECERISKEGQVVVVCCNNSPRQMAVSGHAKAVQELEDRALELGGQISPLIGSAPFHSPLMQEAAVELKRELVNYKFGSFRYPVVSNTLGLPYPGTERLQDLLSNQISHPVRWAQTMKYLQEFGVTLFVEMGPKNILSKLASDNAISAETFSFGQQEDRHTLLDFLSASHGPKSNTQTVVTKCLAAAVAVPNRNFDREDYERNVVAPYKEIQKMQEGIEKEGRYPTSVETKTAVALLCDIFTAKKVGMDEQWEWYNQILDETGETIF